MEEPEVLDEGAVTFVRHGSVLQVTFHREVSDATFDVFLARMQQNLDEGAEHGLRVATIIETKKAAGAVPPSQRRKQAEWLAANSEKLRRHGAGTAFVFESMVSRFVLSSILLLQKMPTDYTVVGSREEALSWCSSRK